MDFKVVTFLIMFIFSFQIFVSKAQQTATLVNPSDVPDTGGFKNLPVGNAPSWVSELLSFVNFRCNLVFNFEF